MKRTFAWSLSAYVLVAYAIVQVAWMYPRWEKSGSEATISWDVFGYYLYLPAFFIYADAQGLNFREEIMAQYAPAGDFHHAYQQEDGDWVMKYAIGQSLVLAPGFAVAHLLAEPLGYPADGFSKPYQVSLSVTAILIALLGLWVLRGILRRYFSEAVTAATLVVIVLATNYLNYSAIDGAMPHNTLFTLYALILSLTIRWHERPNRWLALALGLCIGMATIVRPTDLLVAAIPTLWGVRGWTSLQDKLQLLWQRRLDVILLGLGMLAMGLVQLGYWKYASGSWIHYSYGEFGFYWSRPMIWRGIFGWRKGWLIYTPVMLLALIGFVPLWRKVNASFWAILLFLVVNVYVIFAWEVWWYGGSFGARPLVQSYALLALPLGAFFAWIASRKLLSAAVALFTLGCTYLNLVMTYQAHAPGGGWEAEFMTHAYYWKIFGDPHPDPSDKKFLDVRSELKDEADMQSRVLFATGFEADSTLHRDSTTVYAGQYALQLDAEHQYSPAFETPLDSFLQLDNAWIRSEAMVYFPQMEWNRWQMTQMVMQFVRPDGTVYRATPARIQYTMPSGTWRRYFYEMKIPVQAQPSDRVRVYFWHAEGQTSLFVDDWQVTLFWEE